MVQNPWFSALQSTSPNGADVFVRPEHFSMRQMDDRLIISVDLQSSALMKESDDFLSRSIEGFIALLNASIAEYYHVTFQPDSPQHVQNGQLHFALSSPSLPYLDMELVATMVQEQVAQRGKTH